MRIGTRKSKLAIIQAKMVKKELEKIGMECELVPLSTIGDRNREKKLTEFGGKGAFVTEIEKELLDEKIDIAVHSAKDLPLEFESGLAIGAVLKRGSCEDALVTAKGTNIINTIGTGSPRRIAQLLEMNSEYTIKDIRGNLDTRINKLLSGEYDAICVAMAGLDRMGYLEDKRLNIEKLHIIPAACQGIIAVECVENSKAYNIIKQIDDLESRYSFELERRFIRGLGLGCEAPLGIVSKAEGNYISACGFICTNDKYSTQGKEILQNWRVLADEMADALRAAVEEK